MWQDADWRIFETKTCATEKLNLLVDKQSTHPVISLQIYNDSQCKVLLCLSAIEMILIGLLYWSTYDVSGTLTLLSAELWLFSSPLCTFCGQQVVTCGLSWPCLPVLLVFSGHYSFLKSVLASTTQSMSWRENPSLLCWLMFVMKARNCSSEPALHNKCMTFILGLYCLYWPFILSFFHSFMLC